MDIAVLMRSQHGLCSHFTSRMYNQLYFLGREVNVKGMENPFMMYQKKESVVKNKTAGFTKNKANVCYQLDVVGPESTESLQKGCKVWWLSELYERIVHEWRNKKLQKIYREWSATHSVSFLRENYLLLMDMTAAELLAEKRVLKFGQKRRQVGAVVAGVSVLGGYILGNQWDYVKRQLGIGGTSNPRF